MRFKIPNEHRKFSGVYVIKNELNGKIYVGSAICLIKRFWDHNSQLRNNQHHSKKLQNSYNKYGASNYSFDLLELVENENLLIKEQFWLDKLNAFKNGYNSRPICSSNWGLKHSDLTKLKISAKTKGVKKPAVSIALMGHKQSPEQIQKRIKHYTGSKRTLEQKKKMSAWQIGRKMTNESIEKMRQRKLGKKHSIETIAKRSASLRGKHPSSKPIHQYSLNGNFIKTWQTSQEAWRECGFLPSGTTMVANGKQKSAYGFLWSYIITEISLL